MKTWTSVRLSGMMLLHRCARFRAGACSTMQSSGGPVSVTLRVSEGVITRRRWSRTTAAFACESPWYLIKARLLLFQLRRLGRRCADAHAL